VGAGPGASAGAGNGRAGEPGGLAGMKNRSPEFDGGSPPVIRFWVVGEGAKHG
jgi:hypothetical protein